MHVRGIACERWTLGRKHILLVGDETLNTPLAAKKQGEPSRDSLQRMPWVPVTCFRSGRFQDFFVFHPPEYLRDSTHDRTLVRGYSVQLIGLIDACYCRLLIIQWFHILGTCLFMNHTRHTGPYLLFSQTSSVLTRPRGVSSVYTN